MIIWHSTTQNTSNINHISDKDARGQVLLKMRGGRADGDEGPGEGFNLPRRLAGVRVGDLF